MAEGVIIKTNLPDFKKQLDALAYKFQRNYMLSATNAAAQQFKKAVVANAPILKKPDTRKKNPRLAGTLRRAIYVWRRRDPVAGTVMYSVSWRKGKAQRNAKGGSRDAFYGRFLELGWTPRGPGRRFEGGVRRRRLARERAIAAGARTVKLPFLVPGFQAAQSRALEAFNQKMEARLKEIK